MKKKVIGISGINATDNPGPGVSVARSLLQSRKAVDLVGLSYDVHDPGNYMTNIFSNSFMMPFPTHGWEGMVSALREVKSTTGMEILIPCLDVELPLLIKYQNQLREMGISTLLPTEQQFDLRSKDRLSELCKTIGCKHPKTSVVYSLEELADVLKNEITLPAIVKGRYYKAYKIYNLDTALLKGAEIAAEWGFPLLVQENIEGQEVNLIALSDYHGDVCGRISIKKLLTTQLGKVWTAVTIQDERLDKLCEVFCSATHWRGPFELECITNKNGIYLIEINPRFPAWVYFATLVGVNLPERLASLITDQECERETEYSVGKYIARYTSELVVDMNYFQNLLTSKNRNGI